MAEEALRLETPGVITVDSLEKSDWTRRRNNILPSTIMLTKQCKDGGSAGLLPVRFSCRQQRRAGVGRSFLHFHSELFPLR